MKEKLVSRLFVELYACRICGSRCITWHNLIDFRSSLESLCESTKLREPLSYRIRKTMIVFVIFARIIKNFFVSLRFPPVP